MFNLKSLFICFLSVSVTSLSFSATMTSPTKVNAVRYSANTGNLYLLVDAPIPHNEASCDETDMYGFQGEIGEMNLVASLALAAQLANKEIVLWISNDPQDCVANRYRIQLLEVRD